MFRNLIGSVGTKILQQTEFRSDLIPTFKLILSCNAKPRIFINNYYRSFSNNSSENKISLSADKSLFESDEYITPFIAKEDEKKPKAVLKDDVLNTLKYTYRMNEVQISALLAKVDLSSSENIQKLIDMLNKKGVYKESILNNPWILKNSSKLLENKFNILNSLKMRDINDFVPLLKYSVPRLQKLIKHLTFESKLIPKSENRLYYISDKLNLDPIITCNYISKRLFILEMPFKMLQENLNHMINYGIAPLSIIKDLWAFRYTPKSVEARLERVKNAKKDKIMPWMIRCPERILQRTLKLTSDELEVLGENSTVIDYISKRLDIDREIIRIMMIRHSQVLAVRVPKIKEILDYLLDKEGFSKYDIAQVPRVLCHGLETTKNRIEELKSIGCRPSSLVILCKSRREYEKFVRKWLENKERINRKNIS